MDPRRLTDGPTPDELMGRTPVMPPPADPTIERWSTCLKDIERDLTDLAVARMVWRKVNETIEKHPATPNSLLFDVQARNYAAAQAVAVRRQVDLDPRSVTMARVLGQIIQHPEIVSRVRYVSKFAWGANEAGMRTASWLRGRRGHRAMHSRAEGPPLVQPGKAR